MQLKRTGHIVRKIFKVLAWIIVSIITLFLLILILIQLPSVQNFGRKKIVTFLENKIGTPVQIGELDIDFPKLIVIKDVYFQDQAKDTLLYGGELKVDISLLRLLSNKVEINEISLENITSKVFRDSTGKFNFDYIINAFASEPKVEDTTSSSMEIALGDINLDKININYHDDFMGYDLGLALSHFDTEIKTFDPTDLNFEIDDINMEGLTTTLRQFKPLGEKITQVDSSLTPDNVKSPPINLKLGEIAFSKIKVDYLNEIDSVFTKFNIGKFGADPNEIDLDGQKLRIDNIELSNTLADIYLGKNETAKKVAETVSNAADTVGKKMEEDGWQILVNNVSFKNSHFVYNDNNSNPIPRGIDYSHLDIRDLKLDAESIYYGPDSLSGTINDFGFHDKSGLQIDQLKTDFLYTSTQAFLKDLLLETPNTRLQRSLVIRYPSIEAITKDIGLLQLDADLSGSVLGMKDVLYFVPDLGTQSAFAKLANSKLETDLVLSGNVDHLNIQRMELTGLTNTHIKISGQLNNVTDPKQLFANLTVADLTTSRQDLSALLPPSTIPDNIRVPEKLSLRGKLQANMDRMETDLGLTTSFGNASVKGKVLHASDSLHANYAATISLDKFDVGKLLKQEDQFGAISLSANVNGIGYTPSKMVANAEGTVSSAQVKGYTYRNLKFNGSGTQGLYDVNASMVDPNITFDLVASADLRGEYPAIKSTVLVDSLALLPLNFSTEDIRIHTKLDADIPTLNIDDLQGNVMITQLLVNTGSKRFVSDTITVDATSNANGNSIAVNSPFLLAGLEGQYTLTGIGTAFQRIINQYYDLGPVSDTASTPQIASFYAKVYNSPFLRELVPDLSLSDSIMLNGNINTVEKLITLNGNIPQLKYGTNEIGKGTINLKTSDSAINYIVDVQDYSGSAVKIPEAIISGNVADNQIYYKVAVKDNESVNKYLLAGNLLKKGDNYELSLLPDSLMLDYKKWTVDPQNKIEFGTDGILANAFKLSNNEQVLSIQSQSSQLNAPLELTFSNFKIESLTEIAEQDSLYMGGTINGKAVVSNLESNTPLFNADLTVNNFSYKADTLGDIAITANNSTPDSYAATVNITGQGNNVNVKGNYYTSGKLDFDVSLDKLYLKTIESFTQGNLKNMRGTLGGDLKISGTSSSPRLNGDLTFSDAAMNVSMLNAIYRLDNEKISFRDDGIHFDQFTVKDTSNNEAIIDGTVYTTDYSTYRFNLDINASDFQVISSTSKDNELYYGDLFIDAGIRIRGDLDKPVINGDLTVNDKTDLTIVLPQEDPQVAAREGIVEFFDQDFPQMDSILQMGYDTLNQSAIKGLDLVANIEIDKEAAFNLVVDEANGDFLNLKGEGSLSGGIDPSGKISLTGTYEIKEGGYEMSFNFLRRKFSIEEGSTLTWMGEPTSANINLTAIYVANAAPIDLVDKQLADASETIRNTYKQKLPFNVLLKMQGELLTPELTFDIILPEKNYTVSTDIVNASNTRLQQIRQDPSELNKQVFALLLLNRFVAENPFSSEAGGTSVSTLAKQSVSRLLSEQINKLAADLVTGVQIDVGLETSEDYTTGSRQDRTDLNVGVSKQLLNDRLTVSVGSNFELEGPAKTNERTNNIAGDIQVDYKLTKDGRLLIRGYRVNQYEVAIQGQVVETGLTFILNVNYDKFREILERTKEKKKIKKELEKEQERIGTDSTQTK